MKIYVFGNKDTPLDNRSFEVAEKLKHTEKNFEFIEVSPNKDLPVTKCEDVIILDTVEGIEKTTVLTENDFDKLVLSPNTTVHDFDLGFQLKYLKKIGKLGKVTIIGVPREGEIDYFLIQSTLRKLVAHDMQGS